MFPLPLPLSRVHALVPYDNHAGCIDTWLVRSVLCPMCKADVRPGGGDGAQAAEGQPAPVPVTTPGMSGPGEGFALPGARTPSGSAPAPAPAPAPATSPTHGGVAASGVVVPVSPTGAHDRPLQRPMASAGASGSAPDNSGRPRTYRRSQVSSETVAMSNPAAGVTRPAEMTPGGSAGDGRGWSPPGAVNHADAASVPAGDGAGRVTLPGSTDGLEL